MTRLSRYELKLLLPVMQAFVDGKEVQVTDPCKTDSKWIDTPTPSWDRDLAYRIKPEVSKVVKWVCYWIEGDLVACSFDTKLCAEEACVQRNNNNSGTYIAIQMEGTYER